MLTACTTRKRLTLYKRLTHSVEYAVDFLMNIIAPYPPGYKTALNQTRTYNLRKRQPKNYRE
jgi:hypothetical protein